MTICQVSVVPLMKPNMTQTSTIAIIATKTQFEPAAFVIMSNTFFFGLELTSLVVIMIGSLLQFDEEGRPVAFLGIGREVWDTAAARIGCFVGEMKSLNFCQVGGKAIFTIVYLLEQQQVS